MRPVTWQDFASLLRRSREQQGLSQSELGSLMGCHRIHIWRLEHGRRRPSKVFLKSLPHVCALQPQDEELLAAFEQLIEYRCDTILIEAVPTRTTQ